MTAGDWAISQNLYSNLVEVSAPSSVRPALAENWTQSIDGLEWVFKLRPNLKWSDGTPMTAQDVVVSLKRSVEGTVHTKISPYLKSIEALSKDKIKFVLKTLPENFLTNLAFVDFAVVHPESYAGDFSWEVRSSGPYRVTHYGDDEITLIENPYYWDEQPQRPKHVTLTRAHGKPSTLEILIKDNNYNAAQLPLGLITDSAQLVPLEKKYDIFHGNVDFNYLLIFSKSRFTSRLPLEVRQYLLCQTQNAFWKGRENHSQRATGLRPAGVRGALDLKEFTNFLIQMCPKNKPKNFPKTLEVLVSDMQVETPMFQLLVKALHQIGIATSNKVVLKKELNAVFRTGNFDLAVFLLGASEDDPDSSWRIYQNMFPDNAYSSAELDAAQLERDSRIRNSIYQNLERRILKNAWFIPIMNEYTYVLTDRTLVLDRKQASDWGLQIDKLKFR